MYLHRSYVVTSVFQLYYSNNMCVLYTAAIVVVTRRNIARLESRKRVVLTIVDRGIRAEW